MRTRSPVIFQLLTPLFALTLLSTVTFAAPSDATRGTRGIRRFRAHESVLNDVSASDRLLPRYRHSLRAQSTATFAAENFRLLGHSRLAPGSQNADVWFFDHGGEIGKYAYVGDRCEQGGAKIVNVNDPADPRVVAAVGARAEVSNEDVVVVRVGDLDVLGIGVQSCGPRGQDGLKLFDVTDPTHPTRLSFLPMPGGVHELDMVVRPDGTALALLALPFVEFANTYFGANAGGEFRIVDITDPARPDELSDWGIIADSSLQIPAGNDEISSSFQGIGYFAAIYAHSARAADQGMTAYVSYWDAGVLKFDISDPSQPRLVGRTKFKNNADGDAHSLTPYEVGGKRYVLQNDEDFEALAPTGVTTTATGQNRYWGIEEPWMPSLLSEGAGLLSGAIHDAGDGCEAQDYRGAEGKVVLFDTVDPFYIGIIDGWRPPCRIGLQVLQAADAGAKAVVSNLVSPDDAYVFAPVDRRRLAEIQTAAVGMPLIQISDIDELATRVRRGLSEQGTVRITLRAGVPSWGFLRVFDESTGTDLDGDGVEEFDQVSNFSALPHVRGEPRTPPGAWSIHNTEVHGTRAYSSWYAHGIVALDVGDPLHPRRVGQFIPPQSNVWGVAIDHETGVIYASDIGSGLWIIRPTGAAALRE